MSNKEYYWLNSHSRLFLERGYLEPGVTPEQRIRQIADNAEKILKVKGFADKFEGYMSKGFYSLATPVWTNFGNKRGLPVSCFGSFISDNMEAILTKAAEVGIMSKMGGGTSGFFGDLRPRGTKISVGGESSGAVHFMEIFDKVAEVISQGSARRGSFAAYMPIEHSDIEEFLQIRSEGHSIQNMSIGVTVTDKFMKDLVEGDKDKRKIWAKVIQKRFETGYPYIMFVDTANKNAPKVYKDNKLKIKASNLCVSPDTMLLTREGEIRIGDHEGEEVEVWNGKQWSKTKIAKTGENQRLLKFNFIKREFDDEDTETLHRKSLVTTEYHKFYLKDGSEVRANELKPGDILLAFLNERGRMFRVEVLDVEDGGTGDTYCVNEPLEHKAVFNGILTGNCSEIQLFSDEDNSFVCVLSSLNLLHWDEIKDTDAVETMVQFLDAVCEEFIKKTEGVKYMEPARNFAIKQRALGLGVLGWHSYLQSKMIAFESMQAKLLNSDIWKTIRERADKTTEEMAKEYGEPELLKGYGRRNVTTLAVAPTTSCATPETTFLGENGKVMNFYDLFAEGGLDLNEFVKITVELENGDIKEYKYNDSITVQRKSLTIKIQAKDLLEEDEII